MPWRRTRDPYRIWLSEVMLQQTQVATATPFYQRFLERFPTLAHLARARQAAVLAEWAGLGYYRRALNLHAAARIVVREHSGTVPDDPEAFGRLPGVGRYTVGAVMSIAYARPLPVLDGNVARVLSRLRALPVSIRDSLGARRLWAEAHAWMPALDPAEWNQALMELGALVCTPGTPRCGECPVRVHCRAFALGRPEAFPAAMPRRTMRRVRRAIVLIERRGALLMTRLGGTRLEGLWEPPGAEIPIGATAGRVIARELERLGLGARLEDSGARLRHRITQHDIEVEVWHGTLDSGSTRRATLRFVNPLEPGVAITALAKRAGPLVNRASPGAPVNGVRDRVARAPRRARARATRR